MAGGDVVFERDHPGRYRAATESGLVALTAAMRSSARRSAATCGAMLSRCASARTRPCQRVGDPLDAAAGALGVIRPAELLGDVDHPTRVDHEVGGVDDAARVQRVAHRAVEQLVVGRPGHHPAAQRVDRLGPDHRTERARREHVALLGVHALGCAGRRAERHERRHPVGVDVRDVTTRARVQQVADEAGPDVARALHGHADAGHVVAEPGLGQGGAHAAEDAPRRHRRRVARAAPLDRQAGDVIGLERDDLGVGGARADVLGRQVAAAERVDEPAQRPEQEMRLVRARVAQDDGLAAAQVEPGDGVLVGHPAGQAQHVGEGGLVGRVAPHADAAERGPEGGVVDGDDRPQPRLGLVAHDHLLVLVEELHGRRVYPAWDCPGYRGLSPVAAADQAASRLPQISARFCRPAGVTAAGV